MNIRWGRGLFRVWIFFTVLWIAGSTWAQTRPPPPFNPFDKFDICDDACLEGLSIAREWQYAERATWVFAPPALVLLFGVSLGWVFRGFKPRTAG